MTEGSQDLEHHASFCTRIPQIRERSAYPQNDISGPSAGDADLRLKQKPKPLNPETPQGLAHILNVVAHYTGHHTQERLKRVFWSSRYPTMFKGISLGTTNREPQEYSGSIIE